MCGRFQLDIPSSKKGRQIKERAEKMKLVFSEGEVFPGDDVLCMIPVESKIDLKVMKWGMQGKSFQINARVESLEDKISYSSMKDKRCAVLCSGFYEWDGNRDKYLITTDDELFYLACVFNDRNELLIITQAADEEFSRIHHRCPIVMDQAEMLKFIHNEDAVFSKKKLSFEKQEKEITLF